MAGDLLGPGTIALCEAVVTYQPDEHPSFPTYARHHVYGRMLDAILLDNFSSRARIERAMGRGNEVFAVPREPEAGRFVETDLDGLLRARNIRHLIVTGLTSNVCVESTIREAYHREYFCLLVGDATQQSGQQFIHDAVLYNVETFFGWVTTTEEVCQALGKIKTTSK